ncbi:hypothetical protein TGCAST_388740 [Toxoplasma gondii CAST]|uniref:Uncharacterized protein n=1 Tax=Toxoplasma gondii CAST TaxID=943122 RepID=A0A425HU90_TOXGO|nr:hypothetical protein TGCAST_388740 [Toxoplasma gondii CAST]
MKLHMAQREGRAKLETENGFRGGQSPESASPGDKKRAERRLGSSPSSRGQDEGSLFHVGRDSASSKVFPGVYGFERESEAETSRYSHLTSHAADVFRRCRLHVSRACSRHAQGMLKTTNVSLSSETAAFPEASSCDLNLLLHRQERGVETSDVLWRRSFVPSGSERSRRRRRLEPSFFCFATPFPSKPRTQLAPLRFLSCVVSSAFFSTDSRPRGGKYLESAPWRPRRSGGLADLRERGREADQTERLRGVHPKPQISHGRILLHEQVSVSFAKSREKNWMPRKDLLRLLRQGRTLEKLDDEDIQQASWSCAGGDTGDRNSPYTWPNESFRSRQMPLSPPSRLDFVHRGRG